MTHKQAETHKKVEPPRLLTLPSGWNRLFHPIKTRNVLEHNALEMRRAEREHLKSANECKRKGLELVRSEQYVKAGKELEDAAESMKGAYGITRDETHKLEATRLWDLARAHYLRERSTRPTPEISEILAEHCEKYEGVGSGRYYIIEAEQIRARENYSKEFHALMEIYRAEREIIENHGGQDQQITSQQFEKILGLLSQAARGLEHKEVSELKTRIRDLARLVYGTSAESREKTHEIDEEMKKITHHKVIKGSEKVRKLRAEENAWVWANQNCR